MAQGQIKKGFFFYFGLFVLLLIAVFMVCLVIMMFNPGKTVLWMKYFTGNEKICIIKTTDESKTPIDWGNVTNMEINCTYANVYVQRNCEYNKDGIYIVNQAKGFAIAANESKFSYDIHYEGSVLKVNVTAPEGFLYFSKKIDIILHATTQTSTNFSNLNLTIETTDGSVSVGGNELNEGEKVKLSSLSVATETGNVYINTKFDTSALKSMALKTKEGDLKSYQTVTANGKTGKGFSANCDVVLETNKGLISYNAIDVGANNLEIICKKGNVTVDTITASTVDVRCVQGNYRFGNIYGNLSFENSEDIMIAPNIVVGYVSGNFDLSTNSTNVSAEPDVDITKVGGTVFILADNGTIDILEAQGIVNIRGEKGLSVNIKISEDNTSIKKIALNSGTLKIGYLGYVAGNSILETNKGKIIINFTSLPSFQSTAKLNDNSNTMLEDGKITISHGLVTGGTKNPLTVTGLSTTSNGQIEIKTNASLSYNLLDKESV